MLHNLNMAQRAMASLREVVLSVPPGQFFAMREDLFEEAPLAALAGPGASEAEFCGAIDNISDKIVECRRAGIALKNQTWQSCSASGWPTTPRVPTGRP
jgi:hypothetical protein